MTTRTAKSSSTYSGDQVLRSSYNEVDASLQTSGFLTARVGNKVTSTLSTTSIADDTETFSFYENVSTLLYTIRIIYTDGTREQMLSAERTA